MRRSPWGWAALGLVVLAATIIVALKLLGLDRAALWAIIITPVIPLAMALVGWAYSASRAQPPPTMDQLNAAVRMLTLSVESQWRSEAAIRQLSDPKPLAVRWRPARRPLADHRRVARAISGWTDDVGKLAHAFLRLPYRRLVILGEPGAGKTTLAVLLTLALCAQREREAPAPVLVSATTWDPTREHLYSWLQRRLTEDYPWLRDAATYGGAAAQELVLRRQVLPIVDGLDEIPSSRRRAALIAINRALAAGDPLVVTCRTAEFYDAIRAADVITGAAVIEPERVRIEDAIAFLRSTLAPGDRMLRWEPVIADLQMRPNGPIATALSSPLMVSLIRAVYANTDADPSALINSQQFPDQQSIEEHLLDSLAVSLLDIQSAPNFRTAGRQSTAWDPQSAMGWLVFMARWLRRRDSYELAWWRLPEAVVGSSLSVCLTLAVATFSAVGLGLLAAIEYTPIIGLLEALREGLIYGLYAALVLRLGRSGWQRPAFSRVLDVLARIRSQGWRKLFSVIHGWVQLIVHSSPARAKAVTAWGLIATLMSGAAVSITFGLTVGPWSGLLAAVDFAIAYGLVGGLITLLLLGTALRTFSHELADRHSDLIRGALAGLVIIVAFIINVTPIMILELGWIRGVTWGIGASAIRTLGDAIVIGTLVALAPTARPARVVLHLTGHRWALTRWMFLGLIFGVLLGLVEGLQNWLYNPPGVSPDVALRSWGGGVVAEGTFLGIKSPAGSGIHLGVEMGLKTSLTSEVMAGLVMGAIVGLSIGLLRAAQATVAPEQATSPRSTLRSDRQFTIICSVVIILGGGLLGQPSFVSLANLIFGAIYGLTFCALFLLVRPWSAYLTARVWLTMHGSLPWRWMTFLEDMHQLGIIRQNGAVYQFRHARLQDRLSRSSVDNR